MNAPRMLLLAAALLSLPRLAASAEDAIIYMWVNEDGVTTFSQTRPPEKGAIEIEKPMAPEPATAPPPPEARAAIANERFNENTRERNCDIGHRTMAALSAHKNIYLIGDDGLYHKISDARLAEEKAKAQAIIDDNCVSAIR